MAPGPRVPLANRLLTLQNEIEQLFGHLRMGEGDVLVCEGPAPLVLNPNSAMKVERVRGIFETIARNRGVRVPGRINPRTLQTELLGLTGRQISRDRVKAAARGLASNLFGSYLARLPLYGVGERPQAKLSQDIIDALLIGALAVSRVRIAYSTQQPLEQVFIAKPGRATGSHGGRSALRWCESEYKQLLGDRE